MERHVAPSGVATNVVEPSPNTGPKLLSDTEMMDYLREGYCAFQLDDLPAEYHAGIVERLDNVIEKHGNPVRTISYEHTSNSAEPRCACRETTCCRWCRS